MPTEFMQFEDFPFPDDVPSFCSHTDVLKYIDNFTEHRDLRKYVNHNFLVTNVRPIGRLRFHYDNDNEYENEILVCWHHHF